MNKRIRNFIIVSAAVAVAGTVAAFSPSARSQFISQAIHLSLERFHFSDRAIDDSFSREGLHKFIESLDYNKRFFLRTDIEEFETFSRQLDDELTAGKTSLMIRAGERLQQRLQEVIAFSDDILSQPFDFSKPETIELDPEKREFAPDATVLRDYWRRLLKYQALRRFHDLMNAEEKSGSAADLEAEARLGLARSYQTIFDRLVQAVENDSLSRYFNALIQVFDPHSTYFPPKEKEDFDIEMTGRFEGIGALLREDGPYVKVVRIIPGGPAWRQKELQPGDSILKVAQEGEQAVDIIGMRVVDAVKLIRGEKGSRVTLTVKQPDGRTGDITITRGIVVVEESFARSAVLRLEGDAQPLGYIYLPRFYRDFSNPEARNSTDDVRRELQKLKKRGVRGIILDLRNNSGGSLEDAVRISGLFIDHGPVVQVKDRLRGVQVLSDDKRGTVYDGPLLVLVNVISASASEILAAALQDYERAIIVGGKHSFGKGTVQVMLDLNRFLSADKRREMDRSGSLGALLLTVQKFYRITGGSNQFRGVNPDMVLPDRFDYLEIGERYLDNPIAWDAIDPLGFTRWDQFELPADELSRRNAARVAQSPEFNQIRRYIQHLRSVSEQTLKSLRFEDFSREQNQLRAELDGLNTLQEQATRLRVTHSSSPQDAAEDDSITARMERLEQWHDQLGKDVYLEEAVLILRDLAELIASGSGQNSNKEKTADGHSGI